LLMMHLQKWRPIASR